LVYGSGAVGGYFGGRLAQAGHDVTFIARGAHLEAIRAEGLRVESVAGDFTIFPANVTEDPSDARSPDAVLVCVKAWDVPEAARRIAAAVGPDTFVVPLENGVEAPDQLAAVLGRDRVVPGLCKIVAFVARPGMIRHAGVPPSIAFGEVDGRPTARVRRLRAAFRKTSGVEVEEPADISAALWQKFLFISSFSAVGAVTRMPAGQMRSVPETRRMLETAMREVASLARARGVRLGDDAIEKTIAFIDRLPEDSTASMQRDLMEGRPSELEYQTGSVVRLGKEAGVPTPVNDFLYASLLPMEKKARSLR
jgi:2-dehydropantoate 2-reductase